MKKKWWLVSCCLSFILLLSACGINESGSSNSLKQPVVHEQLLDNELKVWAVLSRASYKPGEKIRLDVEISNTSDEPYHYMSNACGEYIFASVPINSDDQFELLEGLPDEPCADIGMEYTFDKDDVVNATFVFKAKSTYSKTKVDAGQYEVVIRFGDVITTLPLQIK